MMIIRALLLLSGLLLVNAHAESDTYPRRQGFAVSPNNWRQTKSTQFYGYEPTRITGDEGAAGGLFLPGTGFNYYADLFLGGAFQRSKPFIAKGRLVVKRVSEEPPYVTSAYVGHFGRPVGTYIDTVGFALTGAAGGTVSAAAVVQFSNGDAYLGNGVKLTVANEAVDWSYSWDPTGGPQGFGSLEVQIGDAVSTLNLFKTTAGLDFNVNAFGLFQPSFLTPDSNSFLQAYIGGLTYTALAGSPPVIRVRAPQTITTQSATVTVNGTTNIAIGYRVRDVRYRVTHAGKTGPYRDVAGTETWKVRLRVPPGFSRVEFIATSDSGRERIAKRSVRRRP